ncbi:hypothetical protein ACN61_04960 [Escherichia coli]|nr:hypothetical protein ACN61_04960 [Escherichia coli]
MLTIQFLCPLPNGLHARPAWELKEVRFIDSDSVQPTQAELTAHPLPRSLSRLNPDLLYGNVGKRLTLLQSDSLDSYRAIPASAQDSTRLEHSLATLAEQLNQQLRERDGESKTILSAHLSMEQVFAGCDCPLCRATCSA